MNDNDREIRRSLREFDKSMRRIKRAVHSWKPTPWQRIKWRLGRR